MATQAVLGCQRRDGRGARVHPELKVPWEVWQSEVAGGRDTGMVIQAKVKPEMTLT